VPEVTLTRPSGYRTDRLRPYQVYIDRQKVGKIYPDEAQAFQLPPGTHDLQLKMDWVSSERLCLALDENDQQTLICAPRVKNNEFSILKGYELIYWMSLGFRRYIDLRREQDFNAEENTGWSSKLKGSALFLIALVISIAVFALTGEITIVSAVLITACVFVVLGMLFRPVDRAFGKIDEKKRGSD